ncbi:MAG: hypothetical protein WA060_00540 [Minisyncoccia bacterium]
MKKNNKKMSGAKKVAIGAGVATLAAGAFYLFGPKAKAHQKQATTLMAKIKKEVTEEIKKAKTKTAPVYHKVVDTVSANYAKQYKIHEKDIKAFAKKLKSKLK